MSDVVLLRPEALWLALLLPLLLIPVRRLVGLSPLRRRAALALQTISALLLVVALAEPALVKTDENLDLVLVLDASRSPSESGRAQAAAYAQGVQSSAGPNDQVSYVATGAQAVLLTPEEVASGEWILSSEELQNETDLAAGLRLAGSLLNDTGRRRVVVLTDGWETQGRAAEEAARLSSRGVELDVVALQALGDPEVIAGDLDLAPYTRVGDGIAAELRVFSTQETSATLTLSVDGAEVNSRQVSLVPGENFIALEPRAAVEGFHRLQVNLETPDDTSAENNTASGTVVVKPAPRVLLLEDRPGEGEALAAALTSRQIQVDVRGPSAIPSRLDALNVYDAIVLNNVAATSMTLDQQRTLQEYVRRSGRGLVTVGGQTSYAKGGYSESVLEEVLPVSSEPPPRPEQGETALLLILDRSGSMDDHIGFSGDLTKMVMAKEAARLAVGALRAGDTLGVLTFDTVNLWAVPLAPITGDGDIESAQNSITMIAPGDGTSIYPAVQEGLGAMRGLTAPNKHIVLLTDGQEYMRQQYEPLLDQLRAEGISLSTIGIGEDADVELLTRLAKLGQGRYYFTERPSTLPRIVFKELDLALKQATIQGSVQPHLLAPSPILRGLSPQGMPQLSGYNVTAAKEDAVVGLLSDQGDPLLAHWNYGLGRVVSFTSEAGPDWAADWLTWGEFARFWDQAVRWSMSSPVNRQLQPSISVVEENGDNTARIAVESLNPDNSFSDLADITAALRGPSGAVTTTAMSQVGPGRYEAEVPLDETGAYEVLVRRVGQAETSESAGFAVPLSEELLHAGTNDRLLRTLAGGDYLTQPQQALDRTNMEITSPERENLWPYLLAPALVLLLLSVAVRRVDFRLRRDPS